MASLLLGKRQQKHLRIRIQCPQLVLDKMKSRTAVTSILWNEEWVLWIDRHYIAFSKMSSSEVVYLMVDTERIGEEMRNVGAWLRVKSPLITQNLNRHFGTIGVCTDSDSAAIMRLYQNEKGAFYMTSTLRDKQSGWQPPVTTYHEKKIRGTLYRVTSVYKGEIEFSKTLEDLTARKILQNKNATAVCRA